MARHPYYAQAEALMSQGRFLEDIPYIQGQLPELGEMPPARSWTPSSVRTPASAKGMRKPPVENLKTRSLGLPAQAGV